MSATQEDHEFPKSGEHSACLISGTPDVTIL